MAPSAPPSRSAFGRGGYDITSHPIVQGPAPPKNKTGCGPPKKLPAPRDVNGLFKIAPRPLAPLSPKRKTVTDMSNGRLGWRFGFQGSRFRFFFAFMGLRVDGDVVYQISEAH
ncbi:hypothetical protein BU23DRAFT_595897 [Bimuria novae-zelandiae CBS 107.79]|uniref:Uncharacterized protein n=1 Tax=Bimuria novae-zelandiae CBS 107.79 TaxID=1447943 RepID=A0A6A5VNK9_9PLEO|nr:hypothetical protein BU23DRAFT_595897 [Bimuria novae-zelandiae CBS 107.79]